jgi:DNA repair protein RadC
MILSKPSLAADYLRSQMLLNVEEFWALALDSEKRLIESRCLFRGTVDACMIHPRDVFRFACESNAAGLIVAHNHPSENSQPSSHDIKITKRLIKASRLLSIPIWDHLIVTKQNVFSFLENGVI